MPGIKYKGKDGEWHLLNQVMVNEVNVVQTTGTSSADVMSQSAVTEIIEDITPESMGNGVGTCETSAETIAKEVDIEGYKITQNGFVSITFENDVPSGATLNINNQGAKPIYHKGAPIEDDVISSGDTVMFGYDGSHYVVSSLGGGSINLSEIVEINLEQIGGYNEDLIDATITITDLDTSTTLLSTTWQGDTLEYEIEAVTNYKIVVGSVSGYITPSEQQYISKPGRILGINFKYTGVGAYVEATDGTLYRSSEWTSAGKTANSVVLIMEKYQCRVALTQSPTTLNFCNPDDDNKNVAIASALGTYTINGTDSPFNGKTFSYVVATTDAANTSHGLKDGESYTNTIIGIEPSTSYLAGYCNSYIFPDGVTRGYLGGMYEIACIFVNKEAIDACLTVCGGTVLTIWDTTASAGTATSTCGWNAGNKAQNSYTATQRNGTFQDANRMYSVKSYARPIAHY